MNKRLALLSTGICLMLGCLSATSAVAAPTTMVDLGLASTYGVLSGASVANTVSAPLAPHTKIRGDLGVKANASPTGFPPGEVTGAIRFGSAVDPAHASLSAAYDEIAARPGGAPLAGALVSANIQPGLYAIGGAASNTGTLTLNGGGDPNAVFVFQVNGALSFAAASHVVLTNGARASRVFWQVNGAGSVGASADFAGTLIAKDAVGMGAGTLVNGRAFARDGAVTLDNNQIFSAPPLVSINGGGLAHTTDSTPSISGTTDVESPATVTVTIAGQTLTATPAGGAWSVTSGLLANGEYPVSASVTDGAGNPASATQQLTVDTVPPTLTLDGGTSVLTNQSTPTISGTSDVAAGTVVQVSVASQNLNALVGAGGAWNVRPSAISDGEYVVSASVSDPAGNLSSDQQLLTIDTTVPTLSFTDGPIALTNDSTPRISGFADVSGGSAVTVTVANQTILGKVNAENKWSVLAEELNDGKHRVVMSVSDVAGNKATQTQMLTVDTKAPGITINGGRNASTRFAEPTISGTSDAAAGTKITVWIGNRSMSTLLQPDHTWNTNAGLLSSGPWQILARVLDPAGNAGTFSQSLSRDTVAPETKITRRPNNRSSRNWVTFRFVSSEHGASFRCRIDRSPFKPCRSKFRFRVGEGKHRFRVRSTDQAGNRDSTPAKDRFRTL